MNKFSELCYEDKNVLVAACHPWFVEEAMEAMEDGFDEDYDMYHVSKIGFIFKSFLKRPADLVIENGIDVPEYYFDTFEELQEFDLSDKALILTRKNAYWDDEESIVQFNAHFNTNFTTFAECWDWVLDEETSGQNFVVNIFEDGELL